MNASTTKPIIDANALEAIAKERPNEKFLKSSGVLKLIQAIRDLERANRQLQAEQPTQIKDLRKALQFYADGHHFTKSDGDAWDTVSGEPQNYWCDEAGTATVEDGSIAKLALAGHPIKFEDEARRPAPSAAPNNPPMPEHWGVVVSVNGDNILCIGESYLHGKRELNEAEESAVIGVAQHLLAFVGYGLPPSSFDPDADDAARTAAQPETPHQVATQPTAPSMTLPAERSLFKEQFRHLDLEEMPDAWGRPVFKHSHVDAIWHGWRQRAAIALLDTHTRPSPTAQAAPAGATDQDGEAFRTAARLGLTLRFYGGCAQSSMPNTPSAYEVVTGGDRSAAMREAVQRAAAVIESGGESQRLDTTAQAAPAAPHPIAPDVAADLERSDWTPEEALRWYAAGKHYDTVPNGDGSSSARILDNGAVASNALKSLSRDYAEHKGDVALMEAPAAGAVAGPVLWVSPEQLTGFVDKDVKPFGSYIPARKTSAGKFTMPLFAAAPTPAAQADALTQAARDVLAERQRQICAEGWAPEHDDEHQLGELSQAAACYASQAFGQYGISAFWPWAAKWWKPSQDPRRNLEKAGALILAEMERIDRTARKQGGA